MKRIILIIQLVLLLIPAAYADGGIWSPLTIDSQMKAMRKAGFKLSAKDIYQLNKVCLKDQVVGISEMRDKFNFFASGVFVSPDGVIATARRPINSFIKEIAETEGINIDNGFKALQPNNEKVCKNLYALRLVEMVDVTKELLDGTKQMNAAERSNTINERAKTIIEKYRKGRDCEGYISSFLSGEQYVLSLYTIYKDVRLTQIIDNDLVLLRAYVGTDNHTARYNVKNIPLKGNAFATMSKDIPQKGDLAVTIGFPSRTKWYIPSFSLQYMQKEEHASKFTY